MIQLGGGQVRNVYRRINAAVSNTATSRGAMRARHGFVRNKFCTGLLWTRHLIHLQRYIVNLVYSTRRYSTVQYSTGQDRTGQHCLR
jgi:hypothetical protein